MMKPLASPQEFAVSDFPLNGKVLVEAAAGSGKTSNLVWLYLRLLLERAVKPTELVVLTYTRKAAAALAPQAASHSENFFCHAKLSHDYWVELLAALVPQLRTQIVI